MALKRCYILNMATTQTNTRKDKTMKLVKSSKDGLEIIKTIKSIDGLQDSDMVLLERGNKIKKIIKGARKTRFKDVYSVKAMHEAIAINIEKQNKKTGDVWNVCCVCGDYTKADDFICNDCRL